MSRGKSARLMAGVAVLVCGSVSAQEFSYNGDTGPGFWSELDDEATSPWEACAGGTDHAQQSPINIGGFRIDRHLGKLKLSLYPTEIDIFNNGHTIE